MNSSKLSINRVCAVGAAFLGLLSTVTIIAAFLLTRNPAIVRLILLFILLDGWSLLFSTLIQTVK